MSRFLERAFGVVTEHSVAVVVAMLVLTAGIGAGATQLNLDRSASGSSIGEDTEVVQKQGYIQSAYVNETSDRSDGPSPASAYVRVDGGDDGNALSKEALVASLEYQRAALDNESLAAALGDRPVQGVANLVAKRAAGDQSASLADQQAALAAASEREVESLVESVLSPDSPALALLPADYEPGTASAESHRVVFQLAADGDAERSAATAALYDATGEYGSAEVFTVGEQASANAVSLLPELVEFVVPISLLVILVVLAFAYRDLVDVLVGFTGVVVSVVWMFGILGWLDIPASLTIVVGPVLIVGLSVDYGLHVFMRHREERGSDEAIRPPMARGLSSVAVALTLVTLTAAVGFMANATSDLGTVKDLAYGVTLGVLSTFVVSVTLVPALKVTLDSLLERFGFDRRKRALGKTPRLEPLLAGGAALARRAAPVVLVVAVVSGAAAGAAWGDLERKSFQEPDVEVAEWKQNLPDPVGWEVSAYSENRHYVDDTYRAADEADRTRSTILIEHPDGAADPAVLATVDRVTNAAGDYDPVLERGGSVPVVSPLTVLSSVAAEDEAVAETLADADTDGDGVPDRNVAGVYDALYEAAPDRASRVVDRTPDGGYQSVRVVVPIRPDASTVEQGNAVLALSDAVERGDVSVVGVGGGTLSVVVGDILSANILETMLLALAGVTVLLTAVYRLLVGSATLGLVTSIPIGMVTALVVAGMWVLNVPLTVNTALLLSLIIGLGIDYNIHVSDRFAEEYAAGLSVDEALVEATTGTGGALLGSTLTSVGAFLALLLTPIPLLQDFGVLVTLALTSSLVVSVYLLPSLLALWAAHAPDAATAAVGGAAPAPADD
ncbi:efflux RND transporter permease subunit [Halobacterium rubrum]|uniref:efflux RND transporter permease subunit n=1 Tax=Halobacterium TaxID=2239 RepID=UPI001F0047B4|nr:MULTISPECIES: MMPL family transporter [Halobacterium]MDH5020472.1 MMPL family transporter [Halobacterium rubrum]